MANLTVGQRVICNGYPGAIKEICTGALTGMFVVQLKRGQTCVDLASITIPAHSCDICGSIQSYDAVRNRQTGEVEPVEAWYPLEDRRTGAVLGYQCQTCWDRD